MDANSYSKKRDAVIIDVMLIIRNMMQIRRVIIRDVMLIRKYVLLISIMSIK
jgi:hypothetical protein